MICVFPPCIFYSLLRQFCARLFLTHFYNISALPFPIVNIILPCAHKKVIWIYTRWVITSMAYFHFFWYFTMKNQVRQPVRCNRISRTVFPASDGCPSVPATLATNPFPTFSRIVHGNMTQKPVLSWHCRKPDFPGFVIRCHFPVPPYSAVASSG